MTMGVMPNTDPSRSPADMLRRIRELEATGPKASHVTEQHVISKVMNTVRQFSGQQKAYFETAE